MACIGRDCSFLQLGIKRPRVSSPDQGNVRLTSKRSRFQFFCFCLYTSGQLLPANPPIIFEVFPCSITLRWLVFLSFWTVVTVPLISTAAESSGTVLITGANRGIGLALAERFSKAGFEVIGTARSPEKAATLKALGARVEKLDVASQQSVDAMAGRLGDVPIDILINNAGAPCGLACQRPWTALRLLARATAIPGEARLARNADKPTASAIIMLTEH
jgi:hypothetical protein